MASRDTSAPSWAPSRTQKVLVLGFFAVWFAFQILFPLRHVLYPGNVSWTEEGHKFAWQMKLRDKDADAEFFVRDPATGREWQVDARAFLTRRQARKMSGRPGMILQFAHYLSDIWRERYNVEGVEVRARICVSLNGRKPALLIDPERDLARVEASIWPDDWILPLEHPPARPPHRRGRRELDC